MTELKTEEQYKKRRSLLGWLMTGLLNFGQKKLFSDTSEDATSGQPQQRLRDALREKIELKANSNAKKPR
ncbi:MAG: hypothetical protein ACD_12C00824G0001 [uncultured bacterium]|nr:MAG: hypothetical protein ACD_12C00824G0001 [uncultured bacterium]